MASSSKPELSPEKRTLSYNTTREAHLASNKPKDANTDAAGGPQLEVQGLRTGKKTKDKVTTIKAQYGSRTDRTGASNRKLLNSHERSLDLSKDEKFQD